MDCPDCGSDNTTYVVEEVEVGSPVNWRSRGAAAPRYRMVKRKLWSCYDCKYWWDENMGH